VHYVLVFMAFCLALDLLAIAALVTAYAIELWRSRETDAEGGEHLFDLDTELERMRRRSESPF
jgi:hypothetical protein